MEKIKNKKLASIILLFILTAQIVFAGDATVTSGDAELQKNNEVFLSLKNTEPGGREYALVSAGSAGNIGKGNFSIYDKTAGISRLTISSSGNVGIGTTGPVQKLSVQGNMFISQPDSLLKVWTNTEGTDAILFQRSDDSPHYASIATSAFGKDIIFKNSGTERMRITNAGNVGIGTTNPAVLTELSAASGAFLRITDTTNSVQWQAQANDGDARVGTNSGHDFYLMTGGADRVVVKAITGNVGIGTTTPAEKLDVNGNVRAIAFFYSSDERLKTDIKKTKGLEIIKELDGVSFNWKNTGDKSAGLTAQDVEKVFPVAVSTDNSTGIKSLNYGALTAPIVESIKELNNKDIEKDKKIAELQNEIEALKEEIENLKQH